MKKKIKNPIDAIYFKMLSLEAALSDFDDEALIDEIRCLPDLSQKDSAGRSILINAVSCGRKKIVAALLTMGTDINGKDDMGYTALHEAVFVGDYSIVELLITNGCNVNACDNFGNTPIMRANLKTPKAIFKLLISNGALPHHKNNYGVCAEDLFVAYPEILEIFRQH